MSYSAELSFENSFLPYVINEWNKLHPETRNAEIYASFKNVILNFIRPTGNSTYKICDPFSIKLLTRLWLGFSHLSEDIFKHNFADLLKLILHFIFFYTATIILLYAESL